MTKTILIGFGNKARSGKDTAVAHLIETYKDKYDIRRYAFGDVLKTEFYDVLLEPGHQYWQTLGYTLGNPSYLALPHPRINFARQDEKLAWIAEHKLELGNHLQVYATDFIRAKDSFYWTRKVRDQVIAEQPKIALFSDVRFFTEFYYITAFGGYTCRINRTGFHLNDGRSAEHPSETELDKAPWNFDITVGDGDVDELKRDVTAVFEIILENLNPAAVEAEGVANVVSE